MSRFGSQDLEAALERGHQVNITTGIFTGGRDQNANVDSGSEVIILQGCPSPDPAKNRIGRGNPKRDVSSIRRHPLGDLVSPNRYGIIALFEDTKQGLKLVGFVRFYGTEY